MINALLQKSYALNRSLSRRLRLSAATGGFVFLFLWLFEPFGLSTLPKGLIYITLGFGLITFAVMAAMALMMQLLPSYYYNEETWTVGKELVWTLIHIGLIGFVNLLYSDEMGMISISALSLLVFIGYALAVGLFPAAAVILANEARLSRAYTESSAAINRQLHAAQPAPLHTEPIRIPADTIDGDLILPADDLWYASASDNYVEVVFADKGRIRRQLIRTSLKAMEHALAGQPEFLRCHKGYLVNLSKVEEVSGNAQGYKLHLTDCETPIPVSRTLNQTLRERLAVRP